MWTFSSSLGFLLGGDMPAHLGCGYCREGERDADLVGQTFFLASETFRVGLLAFHGQRLFDPIHPCCEFVGVQQGLRCAHFSGSGACKGKGAKSGMMDSWGCGTGPPKGGCGGAA